MTDSSRSVDDRFSSGLIDNGCQILSVPNASSSEDIDTAEDQHQVAESLVLPQAYQVMFVWSQHVHLNIQFS